jgi:hypothetical protein
VSWFVRWWLVGFELGRSVRALPVSSSSDVRAQVGGEAVEHAFQAIQLSGQSGTLRAAAEIEPIAHS